MRYHFNSLEKIKNVKSPIVLIHGSQDTLIPPAHSKQLFENISSQKMMILVEGGSHNDLNSFPEYDQFLQNTLGDFW
jgi:fermentation-respiration switch protein FrsA (DUF1100 family)